MPRVYQIPRHRFLCYRNKQAYFSLAKYVLIITVPILINKDVSSFNDLKFTVQNHNYFCYLTIILHCLPYFCLCVCVCVCVCILCMSTHGYIYTVILCNQYLKFYHIFCYSILQITLQRTFSVVLPIYPLKIIRSDGNA